MGDDDDEETDLAGATPQSALPTAPLQGSQGARYSVFNYSNAPGRRYCPPAVPDF